jgi:putative hydrolases of HD superfamily
MINKSMFFNLYKASYLQRWNDHLRPIDLLELDKQAHKMIIAYILGKIEEKLGNKVDWQRIIEGGIFEFLQRIILTDIKPSLFFKIKRDKSKYIQLNKFLLKTIASDLENINDGLFLKKFIEYLAEEEKEKPVYDINKKILRAAHFLATKWEYELIKNYNKTGYQNDEIREDFIKKEQSFSTLESMKELNFSHNLKKFMNLCGELRYQIRWNQLYRIPKTSVLGHQLIVAIITYFLSLENNFCTKRIYNNFFTGLFHDLPEVMTRDIISPLKSNVEGLDDFIKDLEHEEMKKIYDLVFPEIKQDLKMFAENEFSNIVIEDGQQKNFEENIDEKYNFDKFSVRDGNIVEFADKLSAIIEAYLAIKNGIYNEEFFKAIESIKKRFYDKKIYNIDIKTILNYFDIDKLKKYFKDI